MQKMSTRKIVVTESRFYKFIIIQIINYSRAKKEAEIKMSSFVSIIHTSNSSPYL